jgi:N-acetyl-anhydromuramyl-L-alanine amidase AmpD
MPPGNADQEAPDGVAPLVHPARRGYVAGMGQFISAASDAIRSRKAGSRIDRIVVHTMEGTLKGSTAWFATLGRSPPTAAHYLIGKAGQIVQMVPDEKLCFHAGSRTQSGWNDRSLGIEHEGRASDASFPEAMLLASARVVAVLCKKFSIPADREHIIGHVEVPGATHTDPGANWPWARYMDLITSEIAK